MDNVKNGQHKKVLEVDKKQNNPKSERRLLVELFSLTTTFFLTSILSFSSAFSAQPGVVTIFSTTFTLPYNQVVILILGVFYGSLSLFSFIMILVPSKAKLLGEWIEYSKSNLNWCFWKIFWPLMVIALIYPLFVGIVDASRGMSTSMGRDIALTVGVIFYVLLVIMFLTKFSSRRNK